LLLKKLHQQINDAPITRVTISIDALGEKNDMIRGVKGYFDQALEGAHLLRGKEIRLCANLTGPSADDLEGIIEICEQNNWRFFFNLLDNRSPHFQDGELASVWPDPCKIEKITSTLKDRAKRPQYELEYLRNYYLRGAPVDGPSEPSCVRGFKVNYINSNGDVLSGCPILPPLGNVFKTDIAQIVKSDSYSARCLQMLRRECPGCTCGVLVNLKVANYLRWLVNAANMSLKR
jgi:MoaA/NifB/PqqE/SkfB family radical SAM enzyme